jgi:hypothetical protein
MSLRLMEQQQWRGIPFTVVLARVEWIGASAPVSCAKQCTR